MAPQKKRTKAADSEGARKKARKDQIGTVSDAVHSSSLPKDVVAMLSRKKLLEECFAVPKEERHSYQEQVIQMLTEVMESVEADLKAKIEQAEKQVASSDSDKASKEAAEKAAEEDLATKVEAAGAAKAAAAEAADAVKAAKAAVSTAESEQKAGETARSAADSLKAKLEAAQSGAYAGLKAGTLEPEKVNEGIAELAALGAEFGFDGTLITSLPSALQKPLSARGAFDEMVFKQIDDELTKHITAQTEIITNGEAAKVACEKKVEDAVAALGGAEAVLAAKNEAKAEAMATQKFADAAMKEAAKAVKGHGSLTKQIQKDLETAKEDFVEFCDGAKVAFAELVAYTLIVPEPPAGTEAEAAPAEEPAATAEPMN